MAACEVHSSPMSPHGSPLPLRFASFECQGSQLESPLQRLHALSTGKRPRGREPVYEASPLKRPRDSSSVVNRPLSFSDDVAGGHYFASKGDLRASPGHKRKCDSPSGEQQRLDFHAKTRRLDPLQMEMVPSSLSRTAQLWPADPLGRSRARTQRQCRIRELDSDEDDREDADADADADPGSDAGAGAGADEDPTDRCDSDTRRVQEIYDHATRQLAACISGGSDLAILTNQNQILLNNAAIAYLRSSAIAPLLQVMRGEGARYGVTFANGFKPYNPRQITWCPSERFNDGSEEELQGPCVCDGRKSPTTLMTLEELDDTERESPHGMVSETDAEGHSGLDLMDMQ